MVAFGYYITGYLRPASETALAVPALADGNGARPVDREAMSEPALAETRPVAAGVGVGSRGGTTVVAANGKPSSGSSALAVSPNRNNVEASANAVRRRRRR